MTSFHVLGPGGLGLLWGGYLSRSGLPVRLLMRAPRGSTESRRRPLVATPIKVRPTYPGGGEAFEGRVELEEIGTSNNHISRLLVTTKSYDVKAALTSIRGRLSRESVVVLLPNGLGFYEECLEAGLLNEDQVILGTITHGAIRRGPYEVEHTGFGQAFFGIPGRRVPNDAAEAADDQRAKVIHDLSLAGLGCTVEQDIMDRLWKKLCVNACINPLTAILNCRNGKVLEEEALQEVVKVICEEVANVMSTTGRQCSATELVEFVNRVASDTARNQSSMLQDLLHGRRTEVHYMNGHVVRCASQVGLEVSYNRLLLKMIDAKEALYK